MRACVVYARIYKQQLVSGYATDESSETLTLYDRLDRKAMHTTVHQIVIKMSYEKLHKLIPFGFLYHYLIIYLCTNYLTGSLIMCYREIYSP